MIMSMQTHAGSSMPDARNNTALTAAQRIDSWQSYARQRQAGGLDRIKVELLGMASRDGLTASTLQQTLLRQMGSGFVHDLIQNCAEWRGEKAHTHDLDQLAVIEAALARLLAHVIPKDPEPGRAASRVYLYRWLIPSLGGGLLGLLLLGRAGSVGPLLGVAGGVAGVAWLANYLGSPRPASAVAAGDGPGADGAAPWAGPVLMRGPAHWLLRKARRIVRWMANGLVELVLPTPPSTTLPPTVVSSACDAAFDLLTALVFLRCFERPATAAPANGDNVPLAISEGSVLRALLALVRALDGETTESGTLRDLAEELRQRLEDSGYDWDALPDGTLFQEEHRKPFHVFGLIAAGEPVETLEPCFRRGEVILLPGRITKKRG